MRVAFLFGGSGYIAGFLLEKLIETNKFDKYYVFDLKELSGFDKQTKEGLIIFEEVDVRNPIKIPDVNTDKENSWIFNFAAIHREPGHEFSEYFDTNIPGAENVMDFARKMQIKNTLFTSSIAPYGRSLNEQRENSPLYPETAYGISKSLAEKTHQIWLAEDKSRKLIIVRPSVIYGPNDPGNVYRMINSIKKGTFVLPDGGKVVKAYGYVYGLIDSMLFTMFKEDKFIVYNYAENPVIPLNQMVEVVKSEFGYKKPTLKLSVKLLSFIAFFIQAFFKLIGKKSDIHPVRVRKAGFPTNVVPQYLIDNNFEFKYNFKKSLIHWRTVCPRDFEK